MRREPWFPVLTALAGCLAGFVLSRLRGASKPAEQREEWPTLVTFAVANRTDTFRGTNWKGMN